MFSSASFAALPLTTEIHKYLKSVLMLLKFPTRQGGSGTGALGDAGRITLVVGTAGDRVTTSKMAADLLLKIKVASTRSW